jgi:acetate CoA/acetoacetate CoA-transferase alpha subunit
MFGGFGGIGSPPSLIEGIVNKGVKDLTLIGNDAGFPTIGIGQLITNQRVKKIITSHIGSNPNAGKQMNEGNLEVVFFPQGSLAEKIRAGGVGIGGILVDIGFDTIFEENKIKVEVDGRPYLIEPALTAEVGIVYAKKADEYGNLIYDKTAKNFNPLVAMASDFTIAEVEEIVPSGELDPDCIMTPGIYINQVVQSKGGNWKWVWQ